MWKQVFNWNTRLKEGLGFPNPNPNPGDAPFSHLQHVLEVWRQGQRLLSSTWTLNQFTFISMCSATTQYKHVPTATQIIPQG